MGQNQWYHFGVGEFTAHFRTYFLWLGWDVHWNATHGHQKRGWPCRGPGQRVQGQRQILGPELPPQQGGAVEQRVPDLAMPAGLALQGEEGCDQL